MDLGPIGDAQGRQKIEENDHSAAGTSATAAICGCATGGDPFETGSARPLDFGHWAAHKLEQLSRFAISHSEAVAIGIALDVIYSRKIGLLDAQSCTRILNLIRKLGFRRSRQ